MEIIFNDISLRPWKLENAARLAEIANNKKIADNLRDGLPFPYTKNDAISWLESIIPLKDPPRFFAIYSGKILVGSIGIVTKENIYRKNIELGYFLSEDFWGKGIMTNAIRAAATWAFTSFDVNRVYAEVFADNPGSRRALEKAGFTCEAVIKNNIIKNEIIKDSCIYSVLRENFIPFSIRINS
jgi:ribosomal-protein-alanine N-acetyltransferase